VIAQGNARLGEGDARGAIELFLQARDLAPTSDNAWIALANGYLRNNQKGEALGALQKAIELNPNNRPRLAINPSFESIRADPEFMRITGS
jgi:tetratricopeptide (TPR) repeat protein